MVKRKYTLPRHTNLASQSSRFGAFIIDVAVVFAISLGFFYGCFNLIFKNRTSKLLDELHTEQLNSHLRIEVDGKIEQPNPKDSSESYKVFGEAISYYYLNFLTGNDIDESVAAKNVSDESKATYTVEWYNKNVLGIKNPDPDNDPTTYFTYVKNDAGEYDTTKIGIQKADKAVDDVHYYMQKQYLLAYDNLQHQDYILDLTNEYTFLFTVEFVCSTLIAALITYIIIPIALKNGQTLGKKAFGLALATRDGYKFQNKQLAMRIMPLTVCLLALLIPVWSNLIVLVLVYLSIFLVSFALSMASPFKASLHDFCAQTIVIDYKTSTIFENELEEEAYINKEDNLEVIDVVDENGEEPELKYEK